MVCALTMPNKTACVPFVILSEAKNLRGSSKDETAHTVVLQDVKGGRYARV